MNEKGKATFFSFGHEYVSVQDIQKAAGFYNVDMQKVITSIEKHFNK